MPEWSAYQENVFRDVAEGKGHTVVLARAGAGKSTTIEEAIARVPRGAPTLIVAFNKEIADSMKARIAKRGLAHAEAATCHSYGFRQVRSAFRGIKVDNDKAYKLARTIAVCEKWSAKAVNALTRLVSLAKGTLAESDAEIDALIDDYQIDANGTLDLSDDRDRRTMIDAAKTLLRLCKEHTESLDYDDMIWFPLVHNLRCWAFGFVFVDETQDLNRAQIALILRACRKGGRIIAVGDERQSIYGFRGADRDAIPGLVRELRAKTLKLTVSYRCARSIVAEAQTYVEDFEHAPNAEEGLVEETTYAHMVSACADGDFVLSRTNAPLVSLCWKLLKAGKRATIKGRDIGGNLLALIARARKAGAKDVVALETFVADWAKNESARLLAKDPPREDALEALEDKVACIDALCSGARSIDEIEAKIGALFSDERDKAALEADRMRVVLSSTHKAKGLERDRVWLLRDTYLKRKGIEEENLLYVAITRAKKHLIYVPLPKKEEE